MEFKRSQAIWAIWNVAAGPFLVTPPLSRVPKSFGRRITNLIDHGAGLPREKRSGQKGIDQVYEVDDVLELAVAFELFDLGLPQADVGAFCTTFRRELRKMFAAIPDKYELPKNYEQAAASAARLVIRSRVSKDTLRRFKQTPEMMYAPTAFYPPLLARGDDELIPALTKVSAGAGVEKGIIIGIDILKQQLMHLLSGAPEVRRGRT